MASQILGGIQIVLGVLLIVFNIAGIVLDAHQARNGTVIGSGIFVSLKKFYIKFKFKKIKGT